MGKCCKVPPADSSPDHTFLVFTAHLTSSGDLYKTFHTPKSLMLSLDRLMLPGHNTNMLPMAGGVSSAAEDDAHHAYHANNTSKSGTTWHDLPVEIKQQILIETIALDRPLATPNIDIIKQTSRHIRDRDAVNRHYPLAKPPPPPSPDTRLQIVNNLLLINRSTSRAMPYVLQRLIEAITAEAERAVRGLEEVHGVCERMLLCNDPQWDHWVVTTCDGLGPCGGKGLHCVEVR